MSASTTQLPEYHSIEEFQNRSQKLKEIRELGIDPYPAVYSPTHFAEELQKVYEGQTVGSSDDGAAGTTPEVTMAGRMMLFRAMGKNAFATIQDHTGRIQLMFNRDLTLVRGFTPSEELTSMKFIEKKLDLGDIIGVTGHLFRTHKGELTVFVKEVVVLCKSLLPLPDKHSGLADKGVRYKKRYLDLIINPEVDRRFRVRTHLIRLTRRFFEDLGFLEVETPVLQNIYGGAEARPFTTELNALHQEMYLRISLEIPLKKLIVGGFNRIFEIGKNFRNEGIDRTHNPEFTSLEAYATYMDYNDMMVITEELFEKVAKELFGTTLLKFTSEGGEEEYEVDVKAPWKRISMIDSIKEYGGIDVLKLSLEDLRTMVMQLEKHPPANVQKAPFGRLVAWLFEEKVEHHLIAPHHIIDHPIETTPLCKRHRDPELRKLGLVERFESFVLGREICNSYTELNDPELQRELLLLQAQKKLEGDEEAHPLDEEFIESICQGMPPTGGLGIGIDRMVMLFTSAYSIRDILFFPLMKNDE